MSSCSISENHRCQNRSPGVYLLLSWVWTTATPCCTACQTTFFGRFSPLKTPLHNDVSDHNTPVLGQLHWLPVRQRIEHKVACLVHQSLAGQTPAFDVRLVTDSDLPSVTFSRRQDMLHSMDPQQIQWSKLKLQCCRPLHVEQFTIAPTTRHGRHAFQEC